MTADHRDSHVEPGEKTMPLTKEQIEALREAWSNPDGGFFDGDEALAVCDMALHASEAEKDAAQWNALFDAERLFVGQWLTDEAAAEGEGEWALLSKEQVYAALSPPKGDAK